MATKGLPNFAVNITRHKHIKTTKTKTIIRDLLQMHKKISQQTDGF